MIKCVQKERMKINRYLLSLLLVPVLLFTAKSYAKNISEDNVSSELGNPAQPFVLEDIKPDGSKIEISGISRQKNLSDIVEDMDMVLYPEDKLSGSEYGFGRQDHIEPSSQNYCY